MRLLIARRILALVWGMGSVCLILLVFLLTVTRHDTHAERVELWNWTLSWLVPPLTAILVTFGTKKAVKRQVERTVDWFVLAFVFSLSISEIVGIAIVLVLELWVPSFDLVKFAADSSAWAKSIQTLMAIGIGGFFFVSRTK